MMLLIGAGAVGTILTAHAVAAARMPFRLYVREKDLAAIQTVDQVRVDHVLGGRPSLQVPKPPLTPSLSLEGVRYLVLCVKYPQLGALLDALGPVPPGCTLVSTLNGVGGLRLIRERHPGVPVVPMSIMFNGQLLGPLHARITTKPQILVGSDDAELLGAFSSAGLKADRVAGEAAVWGKLLINLANALCAATHTTFKDLFTHADLRACYVGVLDEAIHVLQGAGIDYRLPMPGGYGPYRLLLQRGGPLLWWIARVKNGLQQGSYPSMVADLDQGRVTEVAQLNGEIVGLGERCGRATPINSELLRVISTLKGQPPKYLTPGELRQRLGVSRH